MQRRKFLIGAGSIATGTAAAMGTGAFSSVTADRSVNVTVADDSSALLALEPTGLTNSNYASDNTDGEVVINLDDTNSVSESPTGINSDAQTIIFDIFKVINQGTQPAVVYTPADSVTIDGNSVDPTSGDYVDAQATARPNGDYTNSSQQRYSGQGSAEVSLTALYNEYYQSSSTTFEQAVSNIYSTGSNNDGLDEFTLGTGESFNFGLWLKEDGDGSFGNIDFSIKADASLAPDTI